MEDTATTPQRPAFKGTHLIVDGCVQDTTKFANSNIEAMINKLVEALDMKIIYGPIFKEVEVDPNKLDYTAFADSGGVSAFCMISTSHIAIHTWELTKTFQMDAFSCKKFDDDLALSIIKEYLGVDICRVSVVERTQLDYA